MKHKVSAVVAAALLAAAAVVTVWIVFASSDSGTTGESGSASAPASGQSASARPKPSAKPSFTVPEKVVDPLDGGSYCATVKLLGIYAHQSYGLDPELGLVNGRRFSTRLDLVAATYRQLAAQAMKHSEVGGAAAKAWRILAGSVTAAGRSLRVTGYDVQSQVMILELAKVARATQTHLPVATSTLAAACGVTREALGL